MGLSLKPEHLRRYRDMAVLLLKYGRSDMVFNAGSAWTGRIPRGGATGPTGRPGRRPRALGPTFVKFGQLLSTRADLCRPSPPIPLPAARRRDAVSVRGRRWIVNEELGVRISKAFSRSTQPIAAASLGQVHRAALRDGREVAVKVQRPNVREQVLKDMETMERSRSFSTTIPRPAAASA